MAIKISSGPPPNYGTMSVELPHIWDANEDGNIFFGDDQLVSGIYGTSPQHMRGGNPEEIRDIITQNYFGFEKYYFEYGVNGVYYCNDWDHQDNLTSTGFDLEVDLNKTQSIWFQVVSQCHDISNWPVVAQVGFWWKGESLNVDAQNPSSTFSNCYYMYMTTNCTVNGQDYGCGSEDLQ